MNPYREVRYDVACGGEVFAAQAIPQNEVWGPEQIGARVYTAARPDGSATLEVIQRCAKTTGK